MTENTEISTLSEEEALQKYEQLFADRAPGIAKAFDDLATFLALLEHAGYTRQAAINKMSEDAKNLGLKGFSQASIYRMLPEEIKGPTKPGPRKNKLSNDNLSNNQAKLADVTQVSIPPPEQPIIEPESKETFLQLGAEQELVHKTIRITMSGKKLGSLGYAMIDKVKESGIHTNYAIEYDYVDKELYIDVTEEWETKLMVND